MTWYCSANERQSLLLLTLGGKANRLKCDDWRFTELEVVNTMGGTV